MKKLAIGCGAVLLLTGIAAAGVAYYVYRQVSTTVAQFAEFAKATDLEREIRNRTPFTPPADDLLSDEQVEKLARVQATVRKRLGDQMQALETKYKSFADKQDASIGDVPKLLAAYRDLAATWMDAKRTQVEALNENGLSLEEYRWIRDQAYRALGQPFVDLDIAKLIDEAKRGIDPESVGKLRGALEPIGPEANRKRIERIKKMLEENLALASFGL